MKPSLIFYSDGSYTGIHHGNIQIDGKVDAYNSYMDLLMRPDLWRYKFDLRPKPYYRGIYSNTDINKIYNTNLSEIINKPL